MRHPRVRLEEFLARRGLSSDLADGIFGVTTNIRDDLYDQRTKDFLEEIHSMALFGIEHSECMFDILDGIEVRIDMFLKGTPVARPFSAESYNVR